MKTILGICSAGPSQDPACSQGHNSPSLLRRCSGNNSQGRQASPVWSTLRASLLFPCLGQWTLSTCHQPPSAAIMSSLGDVKQMEAVETWGQSTGSRLQSVISPSSSVVTRRDQSMIEGFTWITTTWSMNGHTAYEYPFRVRSMDMTANTPYTTTNE